MGFFNVIITLCVGMVMLVGAAITYKNRMAEREAMGLSAVVEKPAKGSGLPAAEVGRQELEGAHLQVIGLGPLLVRGYSHEFR